MDTPSDKPPPLPPTPGPTNPQPAANQPPPIPKPTDGPQGLAPSAEPSTRKKKRDENSLRDEYDRLYDAYISSEQRANSLQKRLYFYRTIAVLIFILGLFPCAGFVFLFVTCLSQTNGFR